MSQKPAPPLKLIVKAFILIRDATTKLEADHKTAKEVLATKQDYLHSIINKKLIDDDVKTIATDFGTAFKQKKEYVKIEDWSLFSEYVTNELVAGNDDVLAFFNKKVNKTTTLAYMKAHNGALPPGVGYTSEYELEVRRPS